MALQGALGESPGPPPGGPKTALHTGGYVRGPRGYVRASKFTCLRGVAGDMCGDLGVCAAGRLGMCGVGLHVCGVLGICAGYVRAVTNGVRGKSVRVCAGVPGYVRGPPFHTRLHRLTGILAHVP